MDDAYITLTYARNLAQTGTVSYNGIAVEGYTSFLHMLIASLLLLVSTPDLLLPAIKLLSLSLGFLMIFLGGRVVVRLGGTPFEAATAKFAFASSPVLSYHTASGLETPLIYVCSLWLLLILLADSTRTLGGALHRVALVVFIGMLVRPDFALAALPVAIYVAGRDGFQIRKSLRDVRWSWLITLIIVRVFWWCQ